jgi:hypothetical protein
MYSSNYPEAGQPQVFKRCLSVYSVKAEPHVNVHSNVLRLYSNRKFGGVPPQASITWVVYRSTLALLRLQTPTYGTGSALLSPLEYSKKNTCQSSSSSRIRHVFLYEPCQDLHNFVQVEGGQNGEPEAAWGATDDPPTGEAQEDTPNLELDNAKWAAFWGWYAIPFCPETF